MLFSVIKIESTNARGSTDIHIFTSFSFFLSGEVNLDAIEGCHSEDCHGKTEGNLCPYPPPSLGTFLHRCTEPGEVGISRPKTLLSMLRGNQLES